MESSLELSEKERISKSIKKVENAIQKYSTPLKKSNKNISKNITPMTLSAVTYSFSEKEKLKDLVSRRIGMKSLKNESINNLQEEYQRLKV